MTKARADYSKHTDDELRRGIAKASQHDQRIAAESSQDALAAERGQRQVMAEELARRDVRARLLSIGGSAVKAVVQVPVALLQGVSMLLSGGAKLAEHGARKLSGQGGAGDQPSPGERVTPRAALPEPGETIAVAPAPAAGQDLPDTQEAEPPAPPQAAAPAEAEPPDARPRDAEAGTAGTGRTADTAWPDPGPGPLPADPEASARDERRPPDAAPRTTDEAPPTTRRSQATTEEGEPTADTGAAATPAVDDQGHGRTYESHIAELADRNVRGVMQRIPDLSTEELGQLFEYESAHRRRKTVLQAIERAAAPGESSAE